MLFGGIRSLRLLFGSVLSPYLRIMSTSSSSARHSKRTSQPPVTLADEQAATMLSQLEERDVAVALLSSLRESWSDEDQDEDDCKATIDEHDDESTEEQKEVEKNESGHDFDVKGWSALLHDFSLTPNHTRSGGVGRPLQMPPDSTPFDLLQLFLPVQLIEEFAHHTNASAPFGWKPTTAQELYAFIGVHLYMGIDRLPQTDLYWTGNYIHSFVTNVFTRDRFRQIRRYFSVVEHDPESPLRDPIPPIRQLAATLSSSFAKHYKASAYLTLDEAMVAFKGRSSIKQYMPMKPHKWGYKIWCLASDNYLLRFEVYEGAEEDASEFGATFDTVMRMVQNYEDKHHVLFCDSWFTSPTLLDSLKHNGILCCGSVRRNRKGLPPPSSMSKKSVQQLHRGESIQRQKEDMIFCIWKDQKVMSILYNHTSPFEVTTLDRWDDSGNKISITCPQAIRDYFYHARSVDIINQLHYSYPTGRKSNKCWSRLVWWLLDISIVNAYKLWSTQNQHPRQLDFRDQLMRQLVEQLPPDQRSQRQIRRPKAADCLAKDHYSLSINVERDCKYCSNRSTERKQTSFICADCCVHLCIGNCFALYHSND